MAEWVYEAGVGEARAALIADGRIVEALIEPESDAPRAGAVCDVRLIAREGRRGIVRTLDGAHEGLVDPLDPALTLGAAFRAQVVREAIPEPGAVKRMKLRATDAPVRDAPELAARIGVQAAPAALAADDALEAAGWSELLEEAATGHIAFPGGALRISLTPAMTLIDVDGALPPGKLAMAGATAAAAAIRRLGIAGSIGIDLPTVAGKTERSALGAAVDAVLPLPFERTAVNGFGFLQIVRPRVRASLLERFQHEAPEAQARVLLRRAERAGVTGAATLAAHPAVIAAIRPQWRDALAARLGGIVTLKPDPRLAISGGHVARTI